MTCIMCDHPIKLGVAGGMKISIVRGAVDSLKEISPNTKIDALLEDYGVCGPCAALGQIGPALFKLINLAVKGGN